MPRLLAPAALLLAALLPTSPLSGQNVPPSPSAPPPAPPIFAQTPEKPLPQPVLSRITAAGTLNCGVAKEEEDFSRATDHGNRAAFDIDLCKAVAVATLGPAAHLVVKSFPDEPALTRALRSGEIDLAATASPTVANMAGGLTFAPTVFFDGQGFLVPSNPAVRTPLDLAGRKVCFLTGSAAEDGLHAYAARHGISYIWYPFSEAGEMEAAFFTRNCDAITSDVSQLADIRAIDPRRAHDFTILPELIRQDPLAPATLAADPRFAAIVHWTVETLIEAEVLGVTRASVHSELTSASPGPEGRPEAHAHLGPAPRPAPGSEPRPNLRPDLQQLLGERYGTGTLLGLDPHWGAHVIEAVGNYGELFDRDLGAGSPLRLDRGENRLYDNGGLLFGVLPSVQ